MSDHSIETHSYRGGFSLEILHFHFQIYSLMQCLETWISAFGHYNYAYFLDNFDSRCDFVTKKWRESLTVRLDLPSSTEFEL